MKNKISQTQTCIVAYAADNNYVIQLGVSLYSLFYSSKDVDVMVYVFSDNISLANKQRLTEIAEGFNQCIKIIEMPDLNDLAEQNLAINYRSKSTYCRLFFTQLLPSDIDKIIWIDCDTLIINSIYELYKINIDNYAIAAVIDAAASFKRLHIFRCSDTYYNAGILSINLKYWRDNSVYERMLAEMRYRKGNSIDEDQSFLNCVLKGEIKTISPRFNWMHQFYKAVDDYLGYLKISGYKKCETYSSEEFANAFSKIIVIHFAGDTTSRPWTSNCTHPAMQLWMKYLSHTEWKHFQVPVSQNTCAEKYRRIQNLYNYYVLSHSLPIIRKIHVYRKHKFWIRNYNK